MAELSKEEIKAAADKVIAKAPRRTLFSLTDIPACPAPDPGPPFRSIDSANLPSTSPSPNWKIWPFVPKVEPWQACALANNIDPNAVVVKHHWHPDTDTYLVPAGEEVAQQLNLLMQLLIANEFERPFSGFNSGVRLRDFAEWCVHIGWYIPQELAALATKEQAPLATQQSEQGACKQDESDDAPPTSISGEPSLRPGKNSREAVAAWVDWQARDLVADGDNVSDIADKIYLIAERWGYQSERQKEGEKISVANIIKMIPAGLTGGRAKNTGKSKK